MQHTTFLIYALSVNVELRCGFVSSRLANEKRSAKLKDRNLSSHRFRASYSTDPRHTGLHLNENFSINMDHDSLSLHDVAWSCTIQTNCTWHVVLHFSTVNRSSVWQTLLAQRVEYECVWFLTRTKRLLRGILWFHETPRALNKSEITENILNVSEFGKDLQLPFLGKTKAWGKLQMQRSLFTDDFQLTWPVELNRMVYLPSVFSQLFTRLCDTICDFRFHVSKGVFKFTWCSFWACSGAWKW